MKINLIFNQKSIIYLFLFFSFLIKNSIQNIYKVTKAKSFLKSLRHLSSMDTQSFLQMAHGDSDNFNYYYTTLYIGEKKKQPQTYILDTGSGITTSPCSKCTSCGKHLNPQYELSSDSSILKCGTERCNLVKNSCNSNNQCSFSISYQEGSSIGGIFVDEKVYLETINKENKLTDKPVSIPIGCTTKETHLFLSQLADGIMGLTNSESSFIGELYNLKIIQKRLFSLCFGHIGGYFSLGEIDNTYHKQKNVHYVPLTSGKGNYYINVKKMTMEKDISLMDSLISGIVDSGTTITYFPHNIYNSIKSNFEDYCKKNGDNCGKEFRKYKDMEYCAKFDSKSNMLKAIHNWPIITFSLEGYEYVWKPEDYYFEYETDYENEIYACFGFEGEGASKITLGGTFMHSHDIIFDIERKKIGFVEADCNRGENGGIPTPSEGNDKLNLDNEDIVEVDEEKGKINNKEKNKESSAQEKKGFFDNPKMILVTILLVSGTIVLIIVIVLLCLLGGCCDKKKKKIDGKKYYPQIDKENDEQKGKEKVKVIEINN